MLKLFFLLFFIINLKAVSKDFCKIHNLLLFNEQQNDCANGQLLFAYLNFKSKKSNFYYYYNRFYDLEILEKYYDQILYFIDNACDENFKIKIKQITNLDKKSSKNFANTIIITCRYNK